jgi:hypothetical protein
MMKTTAAANASSTQNPPRQRTAGVRGPGKPRPLARPRNLRPLARPRNQRPLAWPRNQRPLAWPRNQRAHASTSDHVGVGVWVCVGVVLSSIIDFKSFTAAAPIRKKLCQERRQPSRCARVSAPHGPHPPSPKCHGPRKFQGILFCCTASCGRSRQRQRLT